jgi:hypothetical protein
LSEVFRDDARPLRRRESINHPSAHTWGFSYSVRFSFGRAPTSVLASALATASVSALALALARASVSALAMVRELATASVVS